MLMFEISNKRSVDRYEIKAKYNVKSAVMF